MLFKCHTTPNIGFLQPVSAFVGLLGLVCRLNFVLKRLLQFGNNEFCDRLVTLVQISRLRRAPLQDRSGHALLACAEPCLPGHVPGRNLDLRPPPRRSSPPLPSPTLSNDDIYRSVMYMLPGHVPRRNMDLRLLPRRSSPLLPTTSQVLPSPPHLVQRLWYPSIIYGCVT